MLEDDPVLGAVLALHPSDRARLLVPAALVVGAVALTLGLTLAQVEAWWGPLLTVLIIGLVTLAAGWQVLHYWNREVILYENGFSYREGGRTVFFHYGEIRSIRQHAEQLAYFGGLVRRRVYRFTLTTFRDERLVLGNLYVRAGQLGARLEERVNAVLGPLFEERLAKGELVPFADTLRLSAAGLHDSERDLPWESFGGYAVQGGQLLLRDRSGQTWFAAPLEAVDNIALLLGLLRQRQGQVS